MISMQRTKTAGGFTLIELLVVITIIVLLVGISAPVFTAVRANAARVATTSALTSVASAIDQFKNDHGFLPPLVLDDPTVLPSDGDWTTSVESRGDAVMKLREERYHSVYSLSVYLVGVGEISPDETSVDPDRHDGSAGPGFRDPGIDKAWGGARQRSISTHRVSTTGRVFGPYVDAADGRQLRAADASAGDFPEDSAGITIGSDGPWSRMSVMVDRWDTPIRYYRFWPTRVAGQTNRSLFDAPAEIVSPAALRAAPENATEFDADLDSDLARAEYVLLSAGPDERFAPLGFAVQGMASEGWVSDVLEAPDRRSVLSGGYEDNIRVVR